jgi:dihydrodipicolinate synthase/N-acetylneuraminate lyase
MDNKEPLPAGVHVALATPLTPRYDIDVQAVGDLVEHVIEGGIYGLNVMGSTGEVASLSEPKRRRLVAAVMEAVQDRVPVICAVAQNSFDDVVREVEALASQGVQGALVTPPSYYPISQPAAESLYRELSDRSPLPILIYNIPQFTKVAVAPSVVASLARDGVIAGIKDSSRDFEYFSQIVYATRGIDGFRVFTGSDTMLLASLRVGGDGTIAGGPNLAPSLAVELYQAFHAQQWERAVELQGKVLEMVMATRRGVFPAGIKAGLEILGLCDATMAPPVPPLSREDREHLRAALERLDLLPAPSLRRMGSRA